MAEKEWDDATMGAGDTLTAAEWVEHVGHQKAPEDYSYLIYVDGSTIKAKSGADGDTDYSGSDAVTVIQNALDNLSAGRTWKEKVVLQGTFSINSPIEIPSYTTFDMRNAYLKIPDSGHSFTITQGLIHNSDHVSGNTDIHIIGGILDGNMANQSGVPYRAMWLKYLENSVVDGVKAVNNGYLAIHCDYCENVVFASCSVVDAGEWGFDLYGSVGCGCVGCVVDGAVDGGFGIEIGEGNYIVGGSVRNVTGNGYALILDYGPTYSTVSGVCIVNPGATGIYVHADAEYNTFSNITINDVASGISVYGDHNTFSNIVIEDASYGGMGFAAGAANNIVSDFLIRNATYNGIEVYGDYNIIQNGLIRNTGNNGVLVYDSTYNRVTNVTFRDINSSYYGITEAGSSDYNFLTDNDLIGLTNTLNKAGANTTARNNRGYVTESSGYVTLANGTTSKTVTHGLSATPAAGDVMVTPMESLGSATEFYIDTYTSTLFTINVDADPGQDVDFAWRAIVL